MLSPANPEYLIKYDFQIQKSAQVDDLQYEIIIPEKIVRFFNSESGEATDWPENIVFSPFYSRRVTLPDNIPGLSGRIFTGWNTARDGSGKTACAAYLSSRYVAASSATCTIHARENC